MKVEERLLAYVAIHTTSDDEGTDIPSTERQFDLAKVLVQELEELGLSDIVLTEHCYVYAKLTATKGMEDAIPVGLIAHMDTAPDFSGENVNPQVISNYDGEDVLLEGSQTYLRVSEFPELKTLKGRTLITTDGTTLLGADDKAGIAEIMTAIQEIIQEDLPHGEIWVGFTPDEEIGCGADLFDLEKFKAKYAYTMDGDYEGEVAYENFNAAGAVFKIRGVNVHPGEAKGIMVNASSIACEIAEMLPKNETPETTEGREGFFHLTDMSGTVSEAELSCIVRDHDKNKFQERKDLLFGIEKQIQEKYGKETVTLQIKDQYENMISVIKEHKDIIRLAEYAIRSCGLSPISRPVRGGTDGARLSFMGLPCPNLGTGGYGFHGPYEHISIEGMETAVRVAKYILTHPLYEK